MATPDARIATALPAHPKTKKLIRRIGEGGAWRLVCLFLWVAANRPDGDLSGMSDEDIELAIDWSGDPGAFIAALAEVRFLDGEEGSRALHDWEEWNPWAAGSAARSAKAKWAALCMRHGEEEAAKRMPEYAARSVSVSNEQAKPSSEISNSEESAELNRATSSATSSIELSPVSSPSLILSKDEEHVRNPGRFAEFWAEYPDKTARKACEAKWKAKRLDRMADTIIADVRRRKQSHGKWLDGFVPNPLTYLNQERWQDPIVPRSSGTGAASSMPAGML